MEQRNKELLLKDLCARLPYGIKIFAKYVDGIKEYEVIGRVAQIDDDMVIGFINETDDEYSYTYVGINETKPYLFLMSSMTEDQKEEYRELCDLNGWGFDALDATKLIDWLNKNHFDYRGLIEKGLAIDATGLNIY